MMYSGSWMHSIDRIFVWISKAALLQLIWLSYTLAGLVVIGIFPATIAALGIARKWLQGNDDFSIWKTFKQIYVDEFKKSNVLGWVLLIVGVILYANFKVIESYPMNLPIVVPFSFYLIILFYFIIFVWSFPLLTHYNTSIFKLLKNAFIIGISKIHVSLLIMISLFSIVYVSLQFPAFLFLFFSSLIAVVWIWFSLGVFKKMDRQQAN
ncbi:YesL family protein [Oceanobacillus iheyensis]|uniref:YesL family protein n=1 Tax=Oceanobacillus iheyensis TaxID=182710 RepID=UPI00363742BC